jgi:hypothetical protein
MARFQPGNQAAVGNRGGGRPPKLLREITSADAARVWRELRAIALKPSHPMHARHGFRALCLMAAYIFPKPASIAVDDEAFAREPTLYDLLCRKHEDAEPRSEPASDAGTS